MNYLLVVPTYNEELVIGGTLKKILTTIDQDPAWRSVEWTVVVADNGSTDATRSIVSALASAEPRLRLWTTVGRGKGQAIRGAWMDHSADVYCFMDADLAASPADLPLLIAGLQSAELAIGSRFSEEAEVERTLIRELISRTYNRLAQIVLASTISDHQCGFKAVKREVVESIIPETSHPGWFFDTELLVLASRAGYRVAEVPIHWVETPDRRRRSSINFFPAAWDNFIHLLKLRRRLKKIPQSND